MLPALPYPWMTAVRSERGSPRAAAACWIVMTQPRAVASLRPSEPPTTSGFPVMTPGALRPTALLYSSNIQPITWALV